MRCKQHFSDVSSSVGVCASCLRLRLLHAQSLLHNDHHHHQQQQQQPPPPPLFPRSVSPYISRRKSDASDPRFFTTPQADPTKKKNKLRAFASLFRSKSAKPLPDPFSNPSIGKNKNSLFALDETSAYDNGARRTRWFGSRNNNNNRGMSPDDPVSPEQWKRTPSQARVKASPARSHVVISGIGICLSPLMRPSPSRHQWSGKGEYSGEMRSTVKPHPLSRGSRSRKLADVGRFSHDR